MSAETELARLVREEVARQTNPFQLMQVDSVAEDGTVNLDFGGTIVNAVPANVSYSPRKEGDVVLVLTSPAGWRVIDRVGAPQQLTIPDPVDLEFGPPAPTGYTQASAVWVKDGALYVQTGSGPAPGPSDPPTASRPKPVTLDPSSAQGYRSGRKDSQRIAQGASPDYPKSWSAIWTYGNRIADACQGKTVDRMQIRVARNSKRHGTSKKVRPKLGLHNETSPPSSTPGLGYRWDGSGLGFGASEWMTIPGSQAGRLASGASKGIGMSAGVSNSTYLIATSGCGQIRITFK